MRIMYRSGGPRRAHQLWIVLLGVLLTAAPLALTASADADGTGATGGTVVAWGQNNGTQTDVPAGLIGVTAVAGGYAHSLALKSDGTVVGWGSNGVGQTDVPADLTGVTAVAAGWFHSLALKVDGTVVAWGDDSNGQIDVPAGLTGVIAIAAGSHHSVALKNDGTVVVWGDGSFGQTDVPSGLTGVIAIAAGRAHNLALKNDGTVVAWGFNDAGQATVPPGLVGVVAIGAGGFHSMAVKSDGTVVTWPASGDVPPGLADVQAVAGGWGHSLALKSDGTVVAWGDNTYGETDVPAGLSNVSAIAAGWHHNLAVVQAAPRPDLLISKTRTGGYLGDDVYNTTATGQRLTLTAKRGQLKSFYVMVTNDGTARGTLTVRADAATRGSVMRCYRGGTDITAAMRSPSGWQRTLKPGGKALIRVELKIKRRAALQSVKTATISGSLQGQATDVVKGKIRVVPN